ncbi:MAG: twin-arginine translocase TatA/TatE family subunit [Candidatus Methylumidiphilus sp.]
MGIGIGELAIILAIVVVLFGTKKLKNIGGDLGGAIKSFRSAMAEEDKPAGKPEGESAADKKDQA